VNTEESLATRLEATAALTALVASRIYPVELPEQATMPAVTYRRIDTPTAHMLSEARSSWEYPRFQVTSWGATYASAKAVNAEVQTALDGFAGTMGGVGGKVCWVTLISSYDLPDPVTGRKRVMSDFEIWG